MKNVSARKIAIYLGILLVGYVAGMAAIVVGRPELVTRTLYREMEGNIEQKADVNEKQEVVVATIKGSCNAFPRDAAYWPVADMAGEIRQCPTWYHKGIDITDRTMSDIVAVNHGTVIFAGMRDLRGYGKEVIINHGDEIYTQYAHLDEVYVISGEKVAQGQRIGKMGRTGMATGVHLHFEVRIGGDDFSKRIVNPQRYLSAEGWDKNKSNQPVVVR